MNLLKFILLWLASGVVYVMVAGTVKWALLRRSDSNLTIRKAMLGTGEFSIPMPLFWILYFGYITRVFAGHASGFMFVFYLVLGFLLGYGPAATNSMWYWRANAVLALVFILWTSLLFIIKTPGNLFGLVS